MVLARVVVLTASAGLVASGARVRDPPRTLPAVDRACQLATTGGVLSLLPVVL